MSTYYHASGKQSIKRMPFDYTLVTENEARDQVAIDPYDVIDMEISRIAVRHDPSGNYVWLELDADGTIEGYTRYGRNVVSPFESWIPGVPEDIH